MDNKTEKSQRQPKWDIFEAAILLDGFLAKRKFGKIDSVVMEAKAYRAAKGV